jgi:hypothetical protein
MNRRVGATIIPSIKIQPSRRYPLTDPRQFDILQCGLLARGFECNSIN